MFEAAETFIRSNVDRIGIDTEGRREILRYLDNREYEMAFEGLFLELIRSTRPGDLDPALCRNLGIALGLDRHSVFDGQFWEKFEHYVGTPTR